MINLYDWLQAFLSIVDPTECDDEERRIVNPELQYPLNAVKYFGVGLFRRFLLFNLWTRVDSL